MPDDGSKMAQSSKCKTWYHQKMCARGMHQKRLVVPNLLIQQTTGSRWTKALCCCQTRRKSRRFSQYSQNSRSRPKNSRHTSYQFLEAASHIGCMTKDDWLEVQKLQHCSDYMGMTFPSGTRDDHDYYIAIVPVAFSNLINIFCVLPSTSYGCSHQ